MMKRTIAGIVAALLLIAVTALLIVHQHKVEKTEIRFPVMGTEAGFCFYAPKAQQAVDAAKAEFDRVAKVCNLYDRQSELCRLNALAQHVPAPCSPLMWQLLMRAEKAWQESGGEFDVTVKPLMDLWGFYRKRDSVPGEAEIAGCLKKVGFDKLRLDYEKHTVYFTVKGMALDFGGIAKGLAADLAAGAALRCGVRAGVIDLGGNLRFLPEPPPGKKHYTVAIRDPHERAQYLPEKLEVSPGMAVATSGDYERFVSFNGRRYGHILSPKSGKPVPGVAVTVVAPSALDADVLSTTAFLCGKPFIRWYGKNHPSCRFVQIPE